ncbi:MAG: RNB domain-containing ribonuclease [Deltaproteobacteria bacterium]|nr:MAG: RNB domain-containing ribonuclease [Deltaproteobacteria bacterium]
MNSSSNPPHLALIAVHGELQPVCVLGRESGRVTLVDLAGEERTASSQRLYWSGRSVVAEPAALAAVWDEVRDLAGRADLDGAWLILDDDGPPGDEERISEVALHALGDMGPAACDAVVVAAFHDNTCFRVRQRRLVRETAESVARTREQRDRDARDARWLKLAVEVLAAQLAGDAPAVAADDERAQARDHYLEALVDLAVAGEDAKRRDDAARVMEALERADAFALLVDLGVFGPDENLALRRAGLRVAFPEEVVAAAAESIAGLRLPTQDLRHLLTVAIDDASTVEIDDAVAVDGDRVVVFIADVAAFVPTGRPVDREAAARASTLYLPEGKVPMLPPAIAFDAAALRAGVDRTALAFSFEVRDDGQIIGLEIARAKVHVDHQLDYDVVDRTLAEAPADDPVARLLRRVEVAMDAHRELRRRRGAVFLQRTEVALEVLPDGAVRATPGDPYAPGRQLVSELMIATCAATAQFCAEHQIPCIYRTQARPDGAAGGRGGRVDGASRQYELLRRLKPSVLSTKPALHFTLAVDAYCQLTSPIRRYADLLMHQQLAGWLKTGRAPFTNGQLMQRFGEIERLSSLVRKVESDSRRYWVTRWCEQHPDARLTGHVVRPLGRRWVVELSSLALQLPVTFKRRVAPGEEVTLAVAAADARGEVLRLAEARGERTPPEDAAVE